MSSASIEGLLQGFQAAGGWINREVFGLCAFEDMGFGAIALRDAPPDTPLFHVPNEHILSHLSSDLQTRLSEAEWKSLGNGWSPLILTMMWEVSRGEASPWHYYLKSLPTEFDTPMFWSDELLKELQGTDIEKRIGRQDADLEYEQSIVPILTARPDLFPSGPIFSLSSFHLQGSRILSRSFTIPRPTPTSSGESDEGEEDDIAVMIPMADMLNAAFERDNARLFDETEEVAASDVAPAFASGYTMITTTNIGSGSQIYNTYASPPNSELLRKYGHVDVLPLDEDLMAQLSPEDIGSWPFGNPGDEVEIGGNLIVDAVKTLHGDRPELIDRVDYWLEDGQEDSFYLTFDGSVDRLMVAFVRILVVDEDWIRFNRKGKLPSAAVDSRVATVLQTTLAARLAHYPTTLQEDLQSLAQSRRSDHRRYLATVVRVGEKRVLAAALRTITDAVSFVKTDRIGKTRVIDDESSVASKRRKV